MEPETQNLEPNRQSGLLGDSDHMMLRNKWKGAPMRIETALLSVSDKAGLVEIGGHLHKMGTRLVSTGGTSRLLKEAGVPVIPVSEYTGFPEILDGRVKTLHPRIHAGILARHDDPEHCRVLEKNKINPLGLVVVNLYPFSRTVAQQGVLLEEALEQIDIGGVTLIRAAAKNFKHTTIVVDPADYQGVVAEMQANSNQTTEATRRRLARKAFHHTASYDHAIGHYLDGLENEEKVLPEVIDTRLLRVSSLRYGENPHQKAGLYRSHYSAPHGLVAGKKHQGKELSFNNYMDLDAAWNLCREFERPFCGIIKHTNPCGAAVAQTTHEAFERALECDPVSAFGSVIGFNREVDLEAAKRLHSLFVEAVIAPGYDGPALEVLKEKRNLRLVEMSDTVAGDSFSARTIVGGFLVQEQDTASPLNGSLRTVTDRSPETPEMQDLLFAWRVCKHVKSNAIVFVRKGRTVGVGAGQMSRVDSVHLAARKAQVNLEGSVMASDAFFPFPDGIEEAARVGIKAVIQPGGSIRDEEVIAEANRHGLAMVFTGVRHFRH